MSRIEEYDFENKLQAELEKRKVPAEIKELMFELMLFAFHEGFSAQQERKKKIDKSYDFQTDWRAA